MNKAVAIGRVDEETSGKVSSAQDMFDSVQADLSRIGQALADAEDLISAGKRKKAEQMMESL